MSTVELTPKRVTAALLALLVLIVATALISLSIERWTSHEGPAHKHTEHGDEHGDEHEEGRIELSPAARKNAHLETQEAGPGRVTVTLSLPGEVSLNAEAMAHVSPRVSGAVRTVKKQLGDHVKKGEVLATLDSRELAELQRELAASRERLGLAKATFERETKLWEEKISAEKDFLLATRALKEAEIEYRSASQKLQAAGSGGTGGAGYALVSPLDGTIIEKHINIGEVMKDDTQAFIIADLSKLWVNVTVYARDLSKVRIGQRAFVRAEGIEEPAAGTIAYVGQVVGEQTRSATARIVLDSPGDAWRPGLFVTADVAVSEVDAPVVVAQEAVQTVEGREVVFVQEGDAFEARPVRLGRKGQTMDPSKKNVVEILEGLTAGAIYVEKNSFILKAELGKSEAGHEH